VKIANLLPLAAFAVLANAFASSTQVYLPSYSPPTNLSPIASPYSAFTSWLPVVFIAVLLGIVITSIYYILGYLLNNRNVKSKAISELIQAVETGVIAIFIIIIFSIIGNTILSPISVLQPSVTNTLCTQLQSSKLDFLNPNTIVTKSPTNAICNGIIAPIASGHAGITESIDYGLAATYVVFANVTNQIANNLNAFYVYDGMISFLSKFQSINGFGISAAENSYQVAFSYTPLAGYTFLKKMSLAVGVVSGLSFYAQTIQMIIILLILQVWPYLLAAGLIFRALSYTRRLGGLLIGIVLALVIILPFIVLFEYASLTSPQAYPIGVNSMPYLPIYEAAPDGNTIVYGDSSGFAYLNGQWVYEVQCGNPSTANYAYTTLSPSPLQECPNCYIKDSSLCPNGGYAYETVCGDPNTAERAGFLGLSYYCTNSPSPGIQVVNSPANVIPRGAGISPFILPNATATLKHYSCWSSNLPAYELEFSAFYLIPGYGLATGAASAFVSSALVTSLPLTPTSILGCSPPEAIDAGLALTNIYGITSITAFLIPLFNVLIIYGAAMGLSKMMGGESDILGISKLI
jgi:hypothetical protein